MTNEPGLPPELAELLRDQSVIVPADAGVFELIASWMNAPSDTASATIGDPCRACGASPFAMIPPSPKVPGAA